MADHPPTGNALLERRASLTSELTSASEARRVLRDCLREAGREDWLDAGELAMSEVVTNALLHAHTDVGVWVGVYPDEVCIEVEDRSSVLPRQRHYDDEATTGRGMGLVAAVARSFGVRTLGDAGKVVWFCVGDTATEADPDALLAAWDIDTWEDNADTPTTSGDVVDVVLLSMPATLWLSAMEHHDALIRETNFYVASHPGVEVDIASADRARSLVSSTVTTELERARVDGRAQPAVPDGHPSPLPWVPAQLDLTMPVPRDVGDCFAVLQDVLDLAEALAVDGHLFTRPALPEIIAVRDWACEQVIAQLAGVAPAQWPGTAQERFETDIHDRAGMDVPDWDSSIVEQATRPVIAADDANRIIAVSDALADLVGWDRRDLIGRRVVTVIPPRYREAHVAGFSRHLSTGEAHALGVPLELPVLAKDGTEIECRFLVEQAPAVTGRTVYLAWLDPLGTRS